MTSRSPDDMCPIVFDVYNSLLLLLFVCREAAVTIKRNPQMSLAALALAYAGLLAGYARRRHSRTPKTPLPTRTPRRESTAPMAYFGLPNGLLCIGRSPSASSLLAIARGKFDNAPLRMTAVSRGS